jgi:trehalose/maltose hydrolase-like predicted phosphorylase
VPQGEGSGRLEPGLAVIFPQFADHFPQVWASQWNQAFLRVRSLNGSQQGVRFNRFQ